MSYEETPAVVIDNGSTFIKVGFVGEKKPQVVIPAVVGRPRYKGVMVGMGNQDRYGTEALERQGILTIINPIEYGIITRWDDMEMLWKHIFKNELQIEPSEHAVLLTTPTLCPNNIRARMIDSMLRFTFPASYICCAQKLSLLASGRTTGIVLDVGDRVTEVVPFNDGSRIAISTLTTHKGGYDLSDYLGKILSENGHRFTSTAERKILYDIKEQLCYVALDFDQEMSLASTSATIKRNFEMPDGNIISIGSERFRCPEALFKPNFSLGFGGIHNLVYRTIMRCDDSIRPALFANVVVASGSTLFPGFVERLQKELTALAPSNMKVNIIAPPDRGTSAWYGGTMLASSDGFENRWIKTEEYYELGPSIVPRKCPD